MFDSLADVVAYAYKKREMLLAFHIEKYVSLVSFAQGRIEFYPAPETPANLAMELSKKLQEWTGAPWLVSVVSRQGGQTLYQEAKAKEENLRREMKKDPVVAAVIRLFPGAKIDAIRTQKEAEPDTIETETETETEDDE